MAKLSRSGFLTLMPASLLAGSALAADKDPAVEAMRDKLDAQDYERSTKTAISNLKQITGDPTTVLGNPNGDVVLVEFTDYQCSFCKAAEPRLQELVKKDAKVKWVIKEFPILSPVSLVASRAALASVKQGKYHDYHQAMMLHKGQLTEDNIWEIAGRTGLDIARLKTDMNDPAIAEHLLQNMLQARALKISVVPGFLVDAKVLSGVTNRTVTAAIDFAAEIAAARAKKNA